MSTKDPHKVFESLDNDSAEVCFTNKGKLEISDDNEYCAYIVDEERVAFNTSELASIVYAIYCDESLQEAIRKGDTNYVTKSIPLFSIYSDKALMQISGNEVYIDSPGVIAITRCYTQTGVSPAKLDLDEVLTLAVLIDFMGKRPFIIDTAKHTSMHQGELLVRLSGRFMRDLAVGLVSSGPDCVSKYPWLETFRLRKNGNPLVAHKDEPTYGVICRNYLVLLSCSTISDLNRGVIRYSNEDGRLTAVSSIEVEMHPLAPTPEFNSQTLFN